MGTKMKILITGGTGFIGNALIERLLKENKKICVLVRDIEKAKKFSWFSKIEIFEGCLEDFSSLKKATKDIDVVYHCAALMGDFDVKYEKMKEINVQGTKKLLEACKLNKVKKFIHISSVAAMGKVPLNATEDIICNPITDYDKSKFASEIVVKEFCIQNKIPFVIIRPSMVYGPGEIKNKVKMFQYIQRGYFRIIGKGDNFVDLVYIDDLIDAIISASKSKKATNQIYIISGDYQITMNKFISLIAKYMGVKEPKHIPLIFARIIGRVFVFLNKFILINPPLFKERIDNLIRSKSYNCSKAKKELNYKPKINPEEGIKRTVEWYKEKWHM